METITSKIEAGILGLAIGDALGVPVEFLSRENLEKNPVIGMREYGTHNQPKGTWSDDSSLTFCLMEGLAQNYDLNSISKNFLKWKNQSYWTPHGRVFDIGIATRTSIIEIANGTKPDLCGGMDEFSNGNGSLMRILPMAFYLYNEPNIANRYQKVKEVSSITHAHIRSVIACFIYVEYAIKLIEGYDKFEALIEVKKSSVSFFEHIEINPIEIGLYDRVLKGNIYDEKKRDIKSSGYVLHSLEASLWAFLTSNSFEETVLKAVNLGEDTDTIAAIAGGIAGIFYGSNDKFDFFSAQLIKHEDIMDLIERFSNKISENEN